MNLCKHCLCKSCAFNDGDDSVCKVGRTIFCMSDSDTRTIICNEYSKYIPITPLPDNLNTKVTLLPDL